jgi:diaminohydroxyphosphoribosylaminopyrimidine deaminase/5-amino-6-(5-phosphoribosylamino)uracil reductase
MAAEPRDAETRQKSEALQAAGARVEIVAEGGADSPFIVNALSALSGLGLTSLVLEGGPTLHAAALDAAVVDRVQIFRTPWALGPDGVPWVSDEVFSLENLDDVTTTVLGDDVLIEGYVHRAD